MSHIRNPMSRFMSRTLGALAAIITAIAWSGPAAANEIFSPHGGNAVTRWNGIAMETLPVDPGLVVDSRAFAILHAAIHDAVNGVSPRYRPYTAQLNAPGASIDAAVAAAAHDVLVRLSPSQGTKVEIAYAAALLAVPEGPAKKAGIKLGQDSAAANLTRRIGDGADTSTGPAYVPNGRPGDYDFTPPFDAPPFGPGALFPAWGRVTPFAIELAQHRLPGPDALNSQAYARDFNEVKSIGRLDSRTRTAEQTDIALFWFEFSPMGWNRIANTMLVQQGADVWQSARILALVNFALADGFIAGFDAKYHFRFWRPYTAVRKADADGNDATHADPNWLPLEAPEFFIPPVPDYPSTHSVLGAAAAEVLIRNFGDHVSFDVVSTSLPGVIRHFDSISAAARENGLSRIYGGIHFRHAVNDGYRQGRSIGREISFMLPRVSE